LPRLETEFPPAFDDEQLSLLHRQLIGHCEKLQYRVAILDVPDVAGTPEGRLPEDAIIYVRSLRQTKFAAAYYPWIKVDDPLRIKGLVRDIPPSGHVAGIYARSDRARGVHKPPANEVAEGAVDVRFAVTDILHANLNDAGVNVIRSFAGRGIRVYGARTLDSEMRFVNVRRLLSMIEKAIDQGTQWTVFEPNNILLRSEIDRVVRSYLQTLYRRGMLDGGTPDEAYVVKCDDSTNPPEEIERGRVVCQIGVQPPYPAEFVVALIGKTQDGIDVLQETGGTQIA
jgi:phage tail sheath protein FI